MAQGKQTGCILPHQRDTNDVAPIIMVALPSMLSMQRPFNIPRPKKLKTKSAAAKRFRVTGSGKLKRRLAGKQHHAWSKNGTKYTWEELAIHLKSKIIPQESF